MLYSIEKGHNQQQMDDSGSSELEQQQYFSLLLDNADVLNNDSEQQDDDEAEGGEGRNGSNKKSKFPSKKIRLTQKLDADLLLGDKGLPQIVQDASKINFKGKKGHELKDLKRLLTYYQVWIHHLKPDLNFDAAVTKIEKLCREKRLKLYLDGCIAEERRKKAGIISEYPTTDYNDEYVDQDGDHDEDNNDHQSEHHIDNIFKQEETINKNNNNDRAFSSLSLFNEEDHHKALNIIERNRKEALEMNLYQLQEEEESVSTLNNYFVADSIPASIPDRIEPNYDSDDHTAIMMNDNQENVPSRNAAHGNEHNQKHDYLAAFLFPD